jgi:hypothetical protein
VRRTNDGKITEVSDVVDGEGDGRVLDAMSSRSSDMIDLILGSVLIL